ncbi:[NiFe] hydrogenase nickel incorporation-associated protein HypB [hydrothermal vent metagenome]|uniref:[NiFe] hydrogenase nickel incorporation-associated protein HypB n=1 Tax=hydrothermal vent metagenome TaxID=652676 RepID=A0A3B0UDR6_9ZZZZ
MCSTCGCSDSGGEVKITMPGEKTVHNHHHDHDHHYDHHHGHTHPHPHTHEKTILEIEQDILSNNDLLAQRNRGYFEAKNITAINLVSSPGSGKTSLLEATLRDLKDEVAFAVIEGDQQTAQDADRIDALKIPVVQINTGKGCHLDSEMVYKAFKKLELETNSVLMIENVGNLVCPAMFDLGEQHRVVIISTTEGDDKPIKYPDMFDHSDVCIINKIDLLPYVNFEVEKAKDYAKRINPNLIFFELSATTGKGMEAWYSWLKQNVSNTLKQS